MALRPVDTETFYREVDEELRRDQLKSMWQRYRNLIIGAVVLVIAAIGFFFWWQHHAEQKAGAQSTVLLDAFDDISAGKRADAKTKLDSLSKNSSAGLRAAALLTKADLAIEGNDPKAAVPLFRQVADDKDLPQTYRDLATVRMTALEFDTIPPQQVVDRLSGLAKPGNPWLGSAGEMVAIAYLKLNKPQQAARLFAEIGKDKKLPVTLRARAVQMAGSLGVDAIPQPGAEQEGNR